MSEPCEPQERPSPRVLSFRTAVLRALTSVKRMSKPAALLVNPRHLSHPVGGGGDCRQVGWHLKI